MIFSASLSGKDDFVPFHSSVGNGAYSQMFYVTLQFCAQVKITTLDGNLAIEKKSASVVTKKLLNIQRTFILF